MYRVSEDAKKLYLSDRETIEIRKQMMREEMESYLKQFDKMIFAKEIFEKWEKVICNSFSYWIFPEEDDMKKLVERTINENLQV